MKTPFALTYTTAFLMMSVMLAWLAVRHPFWSPLLGWAAFGFGYMAVAYVWIGPRALFKTREGRHPFGVKVALAPFMFYTLVVWHIWRLLNPEPACNRVNGDLVVGRRLTPNEFTEHVDYYVDLTSEFEDPEIFRGHQGYRSYPILDAMVPPPEKLEQWVAELDGGSVYIHCAQGHGRTGLFAVALLVHRGLAAGYEEALAILQRARPKLALNARQVRFIRQYLEEREA